MSDEELLARDAKRNIAAEIRRGMKEVRAAHGTPFEGGGNAWATRRAR
ncbi:MAG: hypothetical protein JWM63_3293 [Gammaproteobacteria bacterium]|nr:hypothetical protein [Gammaproteobacteria bacterium]